MALTLVKLSEYRFTKRAKIERTIYKNDLMMYDWFILVDIKFLKSLYPCIYLSILNSFSWKTKLPVVLLSMLLSKPSSSTYK